MTMDRRTALYERLWGEKILSANMLEKEANKNFDRMTARDRRKVIRGFSRLPF